VQVRGFARQLGVRQLPGWLKKEPQPGRRQQ